MWHDAIPNNAGWSILWHGFILCRCGGIRTWPDCPVCQEPVGGETVIMGDEPRKYITVIPAQMGAEGRYEDWLYLDLIQREWLRPVSVVTLTSTRLAGLAERTSVVLLFWTYFESRIERLLRLGLRSVPETLRADILGRYSSVGSRMDRLYKLVFGTTYFNDLRAIGAPLLVDFLQEVQSRRNDFSHGQPAAMTDDLAGRTVATLQDEHLAWIAVFNLRVSELRTTQC
jgi:hypothetical protein